MCLFPKKNLNENSAAYKYGVREFGCGVCPECLSKKSRIWALRAAMEAAKNVAFMCTLTYDTYKYDEHGNIIGENTPNRDIKVSKNDLQNFFKRLRYFYPDKDIKYIACAEYGKRTGRAHYHCLIFGLQFGDLRFYKKSKRGNIIYKSKTLEKIWHGGKSAVKGGICTVDCVNPSTACARYCTKYAAKDAGVDDTFMLFSRGIGEEMLLNKFNGKSYWIDGQEYPIPRTVWQKIIKRKYNLSDDYTRYINFPYADKDFARGRHIRYFRAQKKREFYQKIRDNDSVYRRYVAYWKRKGELNEKYKLSAFERCSQLDNMKYWSYKQKALRALAFRKRMCVIKPPRGTQFYDCVCGSPSERYMQRGFMRTLKTFKKRRAENAFAVPARLNTANDSKTTIFFKNGAKLYPISGNDYGKSPF